MGTDAYQIACNSCKAFHDSFEFSKKLFASIGTWYLAIQADSI